MERKPDWKVLRNMLQVRLPAGPFVIRSQRLINYTKKMLLKSPMRRSMPLGEDVLHSWGPSHQAGQRRSQPVIT